MKIKLAIASLIILACAGIGSAQAGNATATTTPVQSITEPGNVNTSLIYFYRIKQFAGSALEPSVYCDDQELARMDNGRYIGVTLEPGKHTCRMGDRQTGFELEMKPGETYYAKITIDTGFIKGHGRLTLLQKEQGAFELQKVKPLGAGKIKNRTLVTIYEGSAKQP
jgi:hypothetical protein